MSKVNPNIKTDQGREVIAYWEAKNPTDLEDDGTNNGGWIRDQMHAHIDVEILKEQTYKPEKNKFKKEGD